MVVIPAGDFLMGSSDEETERDVEAVVPQRERNYARAWMASEHPAHPVSIQRSFALSKYRVTRGEFAAFVRDTGYSAEGGGTYWVDHTYPVHPEGNWQHPGFTQTDRDPVVCVSWLDAKAYIAWLNNVSADRHGTYRLPSEAEWEYATRAGTRTARWWGDPIGSGNTDCDGCGSRWDRQQPASGGSFQTNAFGVSDVLGSAWEWMEDCWNKTYAGAPQDGSAWTTGDCQDRVMRGGGWANRPWILRSANRSSEEPGGRRNYRGFRVAKTLP
ncbi:MAG: formylglycine-generating enzyme family protein [Bradyrhizobium sp.]|nr:formylglycine-generating enzyme family protein [Bradyrhizobium sp.]